MFEKTYRIMDSTTSKVVAKIRAVSMDAALHKATMDLMSKEPSVPNGHWERSVLYRKIRKTLYAKRQSKVRKPRI